MFNLDGLEMHVTSTAASGVVGSGTRLRFFQRGNRVAARYSGGAVARGWLVGRLSGSELVFRYAQREESPEIHCGRSVCDVVRLGDGRTRIIEHFTWTTRDGSGTNVFEECAGWKLRRGLLLILAIFVSALAWRVDVSGQAVAPPPEPYEDVGACPFEGCVYREWTAFKPVEVRAARRANAPVLFRVKAGEAVTALTGVVITLRAGRVRFDVRQRLETSSGPIEVFPWQTLYLLTNQGEGFTKVWFNGRLYKDVDASTFLNGVCEGNPSRCTGRVVEPSKTEWWIQVRNKAGQVGWTREPEKFDGIDFLARVHPR